MSDDRLFASNNPIGKKWYFINIIILVVITFITERIFNGYIIPNVKTDVYETVAYGIMYFLFLIYFITFFALIDRRLYDVCGSRDSRGYKTTSSVLSFIILFQAFILIANWFKFNLPVDVNVLQSYAWFLNLFFLIISFFIGLFKGQFSNLTYEEYRNKIRYK